MYVCFLYQFEISNNPHNRRPKYTNRSSLTIRFPSPACSRQLRKVNYSLQLTIPSNLYLWCKLLPCSAYWYALQPGVFPQIKHISPTRSKKIPVHSVALLCWGHVRELNFPASMFGKCNLTVCVERFVYMYLYNFVCENRFSFLFEVSGEGWCPPPPSLFFTGGSTRHGGDVRLPSVQFPTKPHISISGFCANSQPTSGLTLWVIAKGPKTDTDGERRGQKNEKPKNHPHFSTAAIKWKGGGRQSLSWDGIMWELQHMLGGEIYPRNFAHFRFGE